MQTKIHGVRIYPQSIDIVHGDAAQILLHGRASEEWSDFYYIFRSLSPVFRHHFFANDFAVEYDGDTRVDPLPKLRAEFGASLVAVDIDSQALLLQGDDFERWGPTIHFFEAAFMPVFRERPSGDCLAKLFSDINFRLTSESWPAQMRCVVHMWDDIYWQLFSAERSDIDLLLAAHAGDPRLKMYFVDIDSEFPDPSGRKLEPAT